jgi:two-component system CheB/CheR fusion protein
MKHGRPRKPSAKPPPSRLTDGEQVAWTGVGRTSSHSFPVVGIGASAGGLEAFTQLLKHLPSDTDMAFVLIQHLDPTHTSFLCEALAKATAMPVSEAVDGQLVEPNHVYVISPNSDIAILHDRLTLVPRSDDTRMPHLPVDFFLRSLAHERGSHAFGVVLSGNASDGTEGLRAIKAEDGITFAQDPKSAKFGGMPRSAINAGVVDYCLDIPELAAELVRLSRHPYLAARHAQASVADDTILKQICVIVRNTVGVDFSEYKAATFERRLARRMALRRADGPQAYLALLQGDPEETRHLYEDILIHVTSFFRDPEVFDDLQAVVFPEILKHKPEGAAFRVWVAGCSSGEEVYSLAMALLEFLGKSSRPIQIFGSDVSEKIIDTARAGVYSDNAMRDVSDARRRRFFTKVDQGYRINKSVRDLCVFVQHDLARDPPFSRLDLVSCRNVLIYFDQALQKRVLPTLHYALSQPGFLVLGRTENISGFDRLFSVRAKTNRIFARTAQPSALRFAPRSELPRRGAQSGDQGPAEPSRRGVDVSKHLDRLLLARYAPPGVLINERLDILQFCGQTGAYLQPAPGEPQNNIVKMARGGLLGALRATIARAKKDVAPAREDGVEVDAAGAICNVVVIPFTGLPDVKGQLYVVLFEDAASLSAKGAKATKGPKGPKANARTPASTADSRRLPKLEHELSATKEYLQGLIEDHVRATDELSSANEELSSGNEELQSMNEELETAKEELQSINEELTTVNDELQNRNHEVTQVNSDLVNLLATVDIPLLILDRERRIRRFTPRARSILNVLASDVGRPFDDIKTNIAVPDLDRQIAEVVETLVMRESEVQDRDGRWYRMQIRPYKTTDNRIDGAILSLVDIHALTQLVGEAQQARKEAEQANVAKDQFLAVLSHELRTPLSSILLQAQLLRGGELEPAKAKRAGEAIERGTRMQVQLIDDLLDVSRIISGKFYVEFRPVDLGATVRAALEDVSGSVARKAIELKVDLDASPAMVSGDPVRLQQVVSNLLTNAIKFTPGKGRVTVTLDVADGCARLTVSDTGMGIEPAFLPHVFNRFAQEDTSRTRAQGGLGLGLAIVHHVLELHRGTVRAESPGIGKGSTFSVTLPLIAVSRETFPPESGLTIGGAREVDGAPSAAEYSQLRDVGILVVDDDGGVRDAVAEMLNRTGARVRVAESAAEAMTAVEEFRPEVLLCDIAMPGEDGYTFLRRLRARGPARGGNIPALALTALAGEGDRERALAAGFQMHLAKPVDIDHLTQAVVDLVTGASDLPRHRRVSDAPA